MDLSSTEEQVQLRDSVRRLLDKVSGPDAVRAAEDAGHDPSIISGLAEIGAFSMGLPESLGGFDASLADLAVVATEAGSHLAMAPVVEALVAGRVLASASRSADLGDWIESVASGGRLVTFAPRPTLCGIADLVPGGAVADAVVALDGVELVLVAPSEGATTRVANTAGTAIGDVDLARLAERVVLASGDAATAAFAAALDEWRALTACWLVGLGRSALALGTQYAIERKQFDVPIGSFQAVAHRLADVATDLDGADLLAAKAAWALDEGEDVGARFAATAFWFAGEAAQAVASAALHVHGGYGFMEEYDIQLHFRRAKSTRLLLGDPRRELLTMADRVFDTLPKTGTTKPFISPARDHADDARRGPDFRLGVAVEAFRDEVHDFLAEHVTDEVIERAHATGTIHDWGLHRAMATQGWISAGWPAEYGGGGRSPLEMNVLSEEMYLSGAPVDGIGVASLVAHTILLEGSEWQKATVIPQILSGEVICCLGYSEPESGSDVAACATKAVRDGDNWTIDGSKMFTTLAHEAGYVFLLTRTNSDVAKHKGLTMFVVPMDTPGIEISPVHTMGGERTNITYYDAVQVDDRYRVGEVDGGWKVMMTALVFERNAAWYGEAVRLLDHAVQWAASTTSADGGLMIDDPLVRERLARAAAGNEVANLLGWRAAWLASTGTLPGVEGTMAKLFTTEHYQRSASDLLDLLGTDGVRRHSDPRAPADGWIEATYRHSQVTTIYGGTSEVLRNIIAQRGLGLPRSA